MRVEDSCSGRTMGRRIRRSGGVSGSCRCVDWTYGGIIGLSDQTIVVLAINLNDWGALRIEARVDRQSCEKSRRRNGDSSGVNHFVELTTVQAVAAVGGINA